jgi:hypothetical protein
MPLFVLFVFGAVILGAGAMLSPAWPTIQPRIGVSATLSLALVVGGTIFYASLFGWDTLVIDYLMFALMTSIFLGGTLSIGQTRAEARGEELLDEHQGWPGPQDLSLFALIVLLITLPALLMSVPYGINASSTGLMALAMRDGETLNTLVPFLSLDYVNAPGFNALTAYLSQQLSTGIHTVQFATGAVIAFINIWLAYDMGAEIRDKRLGRAMALTMFLSLGVYGLLLNGYYPALMGIAFMQGFVIYALRYLRHQYPADLIGAGLLIGATLISDLSMFNVMILAYIAFIAVMGFRHEKGAAWVKLTLITPVIAVVATLPWLSDIWSVLAETNTAFYSRSLDNIYVLAQNHGLWVWAVGCLTLWLAWIRIFSEDENYLSFFAGAWLILVFDYAVTGGLTAVINLILPPFTNLVNPQLVAWGGAVIPLTLLGGLGALWAWDTQIQPKLNYTMTYRHVYWITGTLSILAIITLPFVLGLGSLGSGVLTDADVEALEWVRDNAPEDAVIVTLPTEISPSAWVIPITERNSPDLPPLPLVFDESSDDRLTGATHLFIPSDYQREKEALLPENAVDVYQGLIYELVGAD